MSDAKLETDTTRWADGAVRVEGYETSRVRERSGIGCVVEARELVGGRSVCLFVLDPKAVDAAVVQRFRRAADAALRLSHLNLLALHESGSSEGLEYAAVEQVAGETLGAQIDAHGPLSEGDSLAIAQVLAELLAYAQERQVVHGDVSPDRISIARDDGTPKLEPPLPRLGPGGDGSLERAYTMAPEQVLGVDDGAGRADLYGLGVTLYRMLTGSWPHEGRTFDEVATAHVERDLPDPRALVPSLSERTVQVLSWLCARDVGSRYPTASAANLDLVRVLSGRDPLGPNASDAPLASSDTDHNLRAGVPAFDFGDSDQDTTPPPPGYPLPSASVLRSDVGDDLDEGFDAPAPGTPQPFRIKVSSRDVTLETHSFDQDLVTIGRGSGSDVTIDNPIVSRSHAELRREGGSFVIGALSSTNSTTLNGKPLHGAASLKPGDLIVLSDKFHIEVSWDAAAAAKARPRTPLPPTAASRRRPPVAPAAGADLEPDTPPTMRRLPRLGPAAAPRGRSPDPEEEVGEATEPLFDRPAWLPAPAAVAPQTEPTSARPEAGAARAPTWAPPTGYLVFTREGREVRSFVDKGFQMGRAPVCDLRLTEGAPRKAAIVVRCVDAYRLYNVAGQAEAVTLNGEMVPDAAVLADGDELLVCGVPLRFTSAGDG